MSNISYGQINQGLAEKRELPVRKSNGQRKNSISALLGSSLAKNRKRKNKKSNTFW